MILAGHQRLKSVLSHLCGVVLLTDAQLRVFHTSALEEFGLRRTRHEYRNGHRLVLQLAAHCLCEGRQKCLRRAVDRIEWRRHSSIDRWREKNPTAAFAHHCLPETFSPTHPRNG